MRTVDASRAKDWMERGEAVLVDVREPAEFRAAHIRGARSLPLNTVTPAALPPLNGRKLVVQCQKGGRGARACERLAAEDPALEIYNLDGGLEAWAAAGLPVVRSGQAHLPLDRQVQTVIGACVLAAALAAYFADPVYAWVPAFFGAGLLLAGLTGFCGLARLLALMPWNR